MPENFFSCENLYFNKLEIQNINCNFKNNLQGILNFNFYGGNGKVDFQIKDLSSFNGLFSIENLDIYKLANSFNEKIVISGFINLKGYFNIAYEKREIEINFNSVKKLGIKQYMNFGAVELIASLSGGNILKRFGSSNFYYKNIAGKISIKDNDFTIEGLAGEKGENQYLIVKPFLLPGINILIDKKNNTIHLDEFINRVNQAIERIKQNY